MMITAIPTLGGKIAPESDSASEYTLVEGSGSDLQVRNVTLSATGADGVAKALQGEQVQRLLAAELSQELMAAMEKAGIQVFYGANGTISDAMNLISLGILDSMANGGCGCGGGGCGGGSCESGSCESGSCGGDQASGSCNSGSCGCGK